MRKKCKRFFTGPGSCAEVMQIALPLILSTSAFTLQMFIDRVFLMWYDRDAMSAAMMGGLLSFVGFSFFLGTVTYANTFVSQYDGAGRKKRTGPAVWQSIYFSVAAGVIMAMVAIFFAGPIVDLVAHDKVLRGYELTYFRIMVIGAMPGLLAASMSCFYTGRGKTWVVMWVNIVRTCVNIVLDYILIFGKFSLPAMGITGAAMATVISAIIASIIYLFIFLAAKNRQNYNTGGWKFEPELFGRLMKFGVPTGTQFMLDIFGFSLFIVFIGRINPVSFAATAVAFQINTLAFMPMIGFGIATSTLVGRALGRDDPALARKSTWSASLLTFAYMIVIAGCYVFIPDIFMLPYKILANAAQFETMRPLVEKLLLFVAFYCLFDTGNIIFSAALKGAGDTKFVMYTSVLLNWIIMVIPSYLAITFLQGTARLYAAWAAITVYVCALSMLFLLRFLAGKWKTMRVIEMPRPSVLEPVSPVPTVETQSS